MCQDTLVKIEETVIKSFLKCGISNPLNESEYHFLYKDGNEEGEVKDVDSDDNMNGGEKILMNGNTNFVYL